MECLVRECRTDEIGQLLNVYQQKYKIERAILHRTPTTTTQNAGLTARLRTGTHTHTHTHRGRFQTSRFPHAESKWSFPRTAHDVSKSCDWLVLALRSVMAGDGTWSCVCVCVWVDVFVSRCVCMWVESLSVVGLCARVYLRVCVCVRLCMPVWMCGVVVSRAHGLCL